MEEKKIKDMTGNREEKIAAKREVKESAVANAPRAPKRPFVRVSQTGADMTERISAKKTAEKQEPAPENAGERNERGQRPFDRKRNERGHHNRRPERKEGEPKAEGKVERKAEGNAEQPAPEKQERTASSKHEKRRPERRDRRNDKKQEPSASNSASKKDIPEIPAAESKPHGESRHSRRDRNSRKGKQDPGIFLADTVQERPSDTPRAQKKEEPITDEQLRADGLLFTLDDEPAAPSLPETESDGGEKFEVIGIKFRGTGKTYYFSPNGIPFSAGEHAIVETVRGVEYGDVTMGNCFVGGDCVVQPLKPVVRKATDADTIHFENNRNLEEKAKPVFLEKVRKNKLEMQLVDVEYTFDNTKLCFYFTADGRVDFRELVKDLASVFRTRIELRQIGVRDEARLCGGLGVCGRPFCCKSFLADFTQVSIKMAKEQNLSLASAKISGSCGRLMCCLRYEQDTYERESAALPRVGSTVETPKGRAVVLESNFLTGKIKVNSAEDNTVRYFDPEEVRVVAPPPRKSAKEEEAENAEIAELMD